MCQMMPEHSEPPSMLRFNLPRSPEITEKSVHNDCPQNVHKLGSGRVGRHGRGWRPEPMPARQTSWRDRPWPWGPPRKPWGAAGTSARGPGRSSVWQRPWAPKARCAQSCRVRLPGRIGTSPGSIHIRINHISISRRDLVEIRSPSISNYTYIK